MMIKTTGTTGRNFSLLFSWITLNFCFSFFFFPANIQCLRSAAVYLKSILISLLRWDSNVLPTLGLEAGAPGPIQHKCAQLVLTCCNHLAREKCLLQKGYSHWIGLLFKKLFRVWSASCLLNKNPQTQSATEFQPDLKYFTKNDVSFVQREWNTCF